ncbi:X-ray radiation resistance-associated protein 1 isoform X3 [Homo sapiens]|uniref:X-ray radiation resistance-associated protein 1 isoform X3 n=2 Tax=Homo sapiens TaxID=9606 RepID=UPI0005D01424|nr:X-ray radiation resistance-associated protein 1 isoform X3 [Homo sapiens]|eukprot:XP_011543059.1 X-ray radiation resistance-associated protein 1 isoform X4 [Homo sapiens]
MAFSGIYKLDDGKPYLNNCFPARNLLRVPEEGQGHWLVVQKGNLKKKPKGLVGAQAERRESLKATSFEFKGKKESRRENQVDLPGHILDQAFLLKHHCVRKPSDLCTINVSGLKFSKAKENDFKHFHSVIYINASENLLPLEAFHTFPALKELDLAFNGIKTIYVKYGDFKLLEFLDLSFNSLTVEAICDLGILPHLRVLLLTGNGLTSLPPNLAVAEQEASVTSLTSKRYILRFPALETLMLDDNRLSNPSCFASLAGLRRLKKLSLDENRIIRIPYLQQVQLYDESVDWNGGRGSPHKEPQFMLQSKPRMLEDSDEQLDYTVLPMKKDVDRTEVVFSSYPGFSTSEIAKEDAVLPVALFPSLWVPPLLKSFLQERLGIHLIRRKIVKPKHHVLMSRKESWKVKSEIPKVPKQPLVLHHPRMTTTKSPSKDMLEPEAELAEDLPTTKSTSVESEMPTENLEGHSPSCRTFVPLPPICSNSTVHSEETLSHLSDTTVRLSPERPSDEDSKSTESIFLTQVSELPSSVIHKDDLELKEKDQKKPPTAPREVKGTRRKLPTAFLPSKYHGYEELLTAKPDPAFIEPKGIQKNAQALQQMLKHPLLCHSSKPKLDTLQKPYVHKEKRAQRIPIPPPKKTRAQLLDDIFIRLRDPRNITEAPLGAVLHQWTERRLVNHKQYLEAKRLLKEFQARYRQLVSGSLRTVFGTTPLPMACPALSESQPKFGHFLEFMDEFCQEPTASDSQG